MCKPLSVPRLPPPGFSFKSRGRYLYDRQGSAIFDRITEQPEYYLTRTEARILADNACRIREITGPVTLVELGSGYSLKTDHFCGHGSRVRRQSGTFRWM